MTSLRAQLIGSMALVGCFFAAGSVGADPLTFRDTTFLVSGTGPVKIDLFSNPDVVLETKNYGGVIPPESLTFGTTVDTHGSEFFTDTVRFTFHEEGSPPLVSSQMFTTSLDAPRLGFGALFTPVRRTGTPIPATLTVDLLNSAPDFVLPSGPNAGRAVNSFTYSFDVLSPTPEPTTRVLLGFGVAVLLTLGRGWSSRRAITPNRA